MHVYNTCDQQFLKFETNHCQYISVSVLWKFSTILQNSYSHIIIEKLILVKNTSFHHIHIHTHIYSPTTVHTNVFILISSIKKKKQKVCVYCDCVCMRKSFLLYKILVTMLIRTPNKTKVKKVNLFFLFGVHYYKEFKFLFFQRTKAHIHTHIILL